MTNLQEEGMIDKFRGKIREMWGDLTDDDVERAHGNWDQLVGSIKECTGETEDSIRERLKKMREEEPARS